MFEPVLIKEVFSEYDLAKLNEVVRSEDARKSWYDWDSKRYLVQHDDLESYFSEKLKPIARELFGDPTLETTFTMYAKYSKKGANLGEHIDREDCGYIIDYCLSSKTVWPLTVGGVDYLLEPNQALVFKGNEVMHGRGPITDPETNVVEMVFFHFLPEALINKG
jgi:hypothetical protein